MLRSVVAAAAVLMISPPAYAQTRPDFSGKWTIAAGPRLCSSSLILAQGKESLRIQFGGNTEHTVTYKFDGSDMRDALPPPAPRPAGLSPDAWEAHTTRMVTRAAWNGDQFVVVRHTTMTMTWPSMVSGEFERDNTFKDTFSMNQNGQLVIDRLSIIDPLPGGTPRRLSIPEIGPCVYGKAGK